MDIFSLLLIIIFILIIFNFLKYKKEDYSQGALTQLYAKGPQDTYLTGDAWKYIPYWYYGGYPYFDYGPYYTSYGPWYVPETHFRNALF